MGVHLERFDTDDVAQPGAPTGFSKVMAPIMKPALRRANREDLGRLKQILEA